MKAVPQPPAAASDWGVLIARSAAGEQEALADLYDVSSGLVYALALRILGDRDLAEDALVEVYAQAWREASSFQATRGSAASWLLTLTRSRAIDMLRSRRRDRATDPLDSAVQIEAPTPDPETAASDSERRRFVRSALHCLSVEQREAIELAYFAGLSHSEIASRLGQPLGTIKTRVRLGMTRLRELLDHLAGPVRLAGGERS
ncbi:MAG: sigma-70 family RNA polymerase sigma factor [Deltaproteobacteria bacterium]|nr:sigma-70 family RNA polymerase sigma factor [Deltaproteobacteria bacterium]